MSTRWLSGLQVATLYKTRWLIEIFFKADKHDFGRAKVGCCRERGVNRWVILAFLAYTLSSWARLEASAGGTSLIAGARWALEWCLGAVVALLLVAKIEREREVCARHGLSITVHRCNL